ncbi:MAG TPA: hypothetical protein VGO81_11015 [Solirubrobacteraceae bacterium]|jgi:hypothetical protein|nr:hypothetical protein [Solirubrobacteraceae bacterium]
MFSRKLTRFVAAGVAAVAVAAGAFAIGSSSSSTGTSGTANAAPAAAARPGPGTGPRAGHVPPNGRPGTAPSQAARTGYVPPNWQPGTGTIITGAAADKAKAAALAAKYAGTVNRVLKLSDGSYVVHLIATSGPHHVFVSKAFKVTGSE